MSKEMLKSLIELIPDEDIETVYKVVVKFIQEVSPDPDEIEEIKEAKADTSPTIPHEAINWD